MTLKKLFYVLAAMLFLYSPAYAEPTGSQCIGVKRVAENGLERRSFTNDCEEKTEVLWCHLVDGPGYRGGLCREEGKFFQKRIVLNPGATKVSSVSLPVESTIHYAACLGGEHVVNEKGMDGDFDCE